MEMQDKINFLVSKGYEVSECKLHVTKKGTQLNSSVNYAYTLALKESEQAENRIYDGKNGNAFADFIKENNLYKEGEFNDYYDQYLSYKNTKDSFWEDFDYRMGEINIPVKC